MEINKQSLEKLYTQDKKSCREIGLVLLQSPKQISRLLKKFEISARPFSTKGLQTRLGATLSEETKEKIRQKKLGKKLSPEHRAKVIKTLEYGQKGVENPMWKGGKIVTEQGYIKILTSEGYKFEHRLVVEKYLGRKLSIKEFIHHLNENRKDNRIENLIVVSKSTHSIIHWLDPKRRENMSNKMKVARLKKFWSTKKKIISQ